METTEWYEKEQKPVRKGVYETSIERNGNIILAYWDGAFWYFDDYESEPLYYQDVYWRGLTQEHTWTPPSSSEPKSDSSPEDPK